MHASYKQQALTKSISPCEVQAHDLEELADDILGVSFRTSYFCASSSRIMQAYTSEHYNWTHNCNYEHSARLNLIFMVRRNTVIQLNVTYNHTKHHAEMNEYKMDLI